MGPKPPSISQAPHLSLWFTDHFTHSLDVHLKRRADAMMVLIRQPQTLWPRCTPGVQSNGRHHPDGAVHWWPRRFGRSEGRVHVGFTFEPRGAGQEGRDTQLRPFGFHLGGGCQHIRVQRLDAGAGQSHRTCQYEPPLIWSEVCGPTGPSVSCFLESIVSVWVGQDFITFDLLTLILCSFLQLVRTYRYFDTHCILYLLNGINGVENSKIVTYRMPYEASIYIDCRVYYNKYYIVCEIVNQQYVNLLMAMEDRNTCMGDYHSEY